MNETFYKDEPSCVDFNMYGNVAELDACTLDSLKEGYSLIVRHKADRKIVAGIINECSDRYSPEKKEKLSKMVKSNSIKEYLRFGAFLQAFPDIFNRFRTEKIFEVRLE